MYSIDKFIIHEIQKQLQSQHILLIEINKSSEIYNLRK